MRFRTILKVLLVLSVSSAPLLNVCAGTDRGNRYKVRHILAAMNHISILIGWFID